MESNLPFIGIALYPLSLMVNEDRKYRAVLLEVFNHISPGNHSLHWFFIE